MFYKHNCEKKVNIQWLCSILYSQKKLLTFLLFLPYLYNSEAFVEINFILEFTYKYTQALYCVDALQRLCFVCSILAQNRITNSIQMHVISINACSKTMYMQKLQKYIIVTCGNVAKCAGEKSIREKDNFLMLF